MFDRSWSALVLWCCSHWGDLETGPMENYSRAFISQANKANPSWPKCLAEKRGAVVTHSEALETCALFLSLIHIVYGVQRSFKTHRFNNIVLSLMTSHAGGGVITSSNESIRGLRDAAVMNMASKNMSFNSLRRCLWMFVETMVSGNTKSLNYVGNDGFETIAG